MNRLMEAPERKLTFAEICEALASGKLASTIEDGNYSIRQSDLRGLLRGREGMVAATRSARPTELAS